MFRAAFVLLIVTTAAAQTASPDTQALQALVTEIRQLRLDLQATTIATQRVQIVLYRLQTQTALATRASSHMASTARISALHDCSRSSPRLSRLTSLSALYVLKRASMSRK